MFSRWLLNLVRIDGCKTSARIDGFRVFLVERRIVRGKHILGQVPDDVLRFLTQASGQQERT